MKYYNTDAIRSKNALYNFIIGERSNGKTTALLIDIVRGYWNDGGRGAIIRQTEEDIKGHRGGTIFKAMVQNGMISDLTDGEWTGVKYRQRAYYFTKRDEENGKEIVDEQPFCYIFSLSAAHHNKGTSYPGVTTIFFDEFMNARAIYMRDEVDLFFNLVSTIVREHAVAKIFLVANTVSWNNPYFERFGIRDVAKMEPGEIATAMIGGDDGMKIAIEYTESSEDYGGKPSDIYFQIDDDRVGMITNGQFAIPQYPKLENEVWTARNVRCKYWFECTNGKKLRVQLIYANRQLFTYCDLVTDEVYDALVDYKRDIIFSPTPGLMSNERIDPMNPRDQRGAYLATTILNGKMRFESNEVGEELRYYITQVAGLTSVNRT